MFSSRYVQALLLTLLCGTGGALPVAAQTSASSNPDSQTSVTSPGITTPGSATEVTFGGSGFYPPFHFINDRGIPDGFDVSIFNRIAGLHLWQPQHRLDDWVLIQQALTSGEVDMVPMFVSEERQTRYLFSDPFHMEYHLLFGPATAETWSSLTALDGQRVAAEGGAYATAELQRLNPRVSIVDASSEADALRRVDAGEADLALLPAEIGRYTIRTQQLHHLSALSPPLLPTSYAFAITPTRPELLTPVNQAIAQLQREGSLESLRNNWLYQEPENYLQTARNIALWSLPMVILLLATLLIVRRYYRMKLDEASARVNANPAANGHSTQQTPAPVKHVHDLTGLPERKLFTDKLEYELAVSRHDRRPRSLLVVKLLNLDIIQDAVSDDAGEELLSKFSRNIPAACREQCGYIGPGVFGFVLTGHQHSDGAVQSAMELIMQCSADIPVQDWCIHPQLCGGMAWFPEDASSAQELLQKARLAMNHAKRAGTTLQLYSATMKPDPARIQIISDLRQALNQRRLQWALQPQFRVKDRRVYGAELLVRWHHDQHGWMPPGDFISWAEEAGLIAQVSGQVIDATVDLLGSLSNPDESFQLSINLSANDLVDDATVASIIERVDGMARRLTVEVTETALMRDKSAAIRNTDRLKSSGFRIALDDYGTGYASMDYLQSFNFDEIKIDRRFINDITRIDRNRKLTQASIELGHQLGARMVAEGVEDTQTAAMLIDMGCDVLQGYQIGRPALLGDFHDMRQSWRQVSL